VVSFVQDDKRDNVLDLPMQKIRDSPFPGLQVHAHPIKPQIPGSIDQQSRKHILIYDTPLLVEVLVVLHWFCPELCESKSIGSYANEFGEDMATSERRELDIELCTAVYVL
jgi:hypothetical protein